MLPLHTGEPCVTASAKFLKLGLLHCAWRPWSGGDMKLFVSSFRFWIGMSHNPSCKLRSPCNNMSFFLYVVFIFFDFIATRFFLLRIIVQLSSHICPSEMSEDDVRFFSTVASCAWRDRLLDKFIVPFWEGFILSPSGKVTGGPEKFCKFERQWTSSSLQ